MPQTSFELKYDGPALKSGEMPVRDLAPALLALGELFVVASQTIYPDRDPVAVNIKATQDGSFAVWLTIHSDAMWDQIVRVFGSREVSALANLKDLLLAPGIGVIWLCKRMHDRRIVAEEPAGPGMTTLQLDDETSVEVPSDTLRLWRNVRVRKETREVVGPLTRAGVTTLEISLPDAPDSLVVDESELSAFEPTPDEDPRENERETTVEIVAPSFHSRSWRLSEGGPTFWARIEDDFFWGRVKGRTESFVAGDLLDCRLRAVQQVTSEGLSQDFYVVEVLRHHRSPVQLSFDSEDEADA